MKLKKIIENCLKVFGIAMSRAFDFTEAMIKVIRNFKKLGILSQDGQCGWINSALKK